MNDELELRFDGDKGIFQAVACTYGRQDQHGTVWEPGCFRESLQRQLPELRWAHRQVDGRVGQIIDVHDTAERLEVRGQLDDPSAASTERRRGFIRRAWRALKARAIEEFSVGARTRRGDPEWTEHRGGVPHFKRADLVEISLVMEGSVPDTALLDFRAADPSEYGPIGQRLAAIEGLTIAQPTMPADVRTALAAADAALEEAMRR